MVNLAWRLAPDADLLYAADPDWWASSEAPAPGEGPALKVTQDLRAAMSRPDLLHVPSEAGDGLSADPLRIRQGGNSGAQAINLARHLGARQVVLLGFDMAFAPDGRKHWHGDHAPGLRNPPEHKLADWRASLATLAADAVREGLEIVNASRRTALTCFPRVALEALP